MILAFSYPFMKRITYWPQLFWDSPLIGELLWVGHLLTTVFQLKY